MIGKNYIAINPFGKIGDWIVDKTAKGIESIIVSVANNSYWVLLSIAMIALFLCVAGQKQFKKYISLPALVYFILQCLKGVMI